MTHWSRLVLIAVLVPCSMPAHAVSVSIYHMSNSLCGQPTGGLQAQVSGGVPPYTYAWSNGPTTDLNLGLSPGTYTVIVTDAVLDSDTATEVVSVQPAYSFSSYNEDGGYCLPEQPYVSFYAGTENGMPPDPMTGSQHGPGPYTFDAVGYSESWMELPDACTWFSYYIVNINAPPWTLVTVNYADGAGCPGSFQTTIKPPILFPTMQVLSVTGSCSNGAIGSATVSVAANGQALTLHLRDAGGAYVPDECAYAWVSDLPITHTFEDLAPGDYWAVLDCDLYNQFANGAFCTDSVLITVPDLGTLCGQVNGRIYVDGNANCILNGGENLVPGTVLEITPGPYYTTTNANGQYSVNLPYDTYTIAEQHPVLTQSCPVNVTVSSGTPINNMNIGCAPGAPLDVQLLMSNGAARPGFPLHYAMVIDNLTPSPTGTVTLTMTFNPVLIYNSASYLPTSVVGNTITWTAPLFTMTSAFQHIGLNVHFTVPPDLGLVGSSLVTTATIATANTDAGLTNNTITSSQLVTASMDPNDKSVVTQAGGSQQYFIGEDNWLDYTIRFQNTGTDTAFNVVIRDTLPTTLDPGTLWIGGASHPFTWSLASNGVLSFYFANILLPDSNVNEPLSHGFVGFRIRPAEPLLPGTVVSNAADIYFDFNPPVHTNDAVMMLEMSTGLNANEHDARMIMVPNPADHEVMVSLAHQGDQLLKVELLSVDGRLLRSRGATGRSCQLDLSKIPSGVHIVRVFTASGAILQQRLVHR